MKEGKKCNDFKVYISSFFPPLESAGFCCENSSFGPKHETVGIESGSCTIQTFFLMYPSTSWHILSPKWRKTLRIFMPIKPHDITHAFCQCFLHWAVSSAFPGCRYAESMFEHPWQGSVWQSPFSESSATWAKTGSCSLVLLKNSLVITALLWIGCTVFSLFCTWAME